MMVDDEDCLKYNTKIISLWLTLMTNERIINTDGRKMSHVTSKVRYDPTMMINDMMMI